MTAQPDESSEQTIESALADLFQMAFSPRFYERQVDLARVPLTRTGMNALTQVIDHGPLSVSALAAVMEMSMPTASRQLRQLEELGYASRRADPHDGRTAIYTASARGRRASRRMREVRYQMMVGALAHWTDEERAQAADLLRRLVHDLRGGRDSSARSRRGRRTPDTGQ